MSTNTSEQEIKAPDEINSVAVEPQNVETHVKAAVATASNSVDADQIAGKILPQINASVIKTIEDQTLRMEQEAADNQRTEALVANFTKNLDDYGKENPETYKKIKSEGRGGVLLGLPIEDMPVLLKMKNAPEILAHFLENPKELEKYKGEQSLTERSDYLKIKSGEIKERKRAAKQKEEGSSDSKETRYQFSNAPEPIDKIKESSGGNLKNFDDLVTLPDAQYAKVREAQLLQKIQQ